MNLEQRREQLQNAAAGSLPLRLAFVGLVNEMLTELADAGPLEAPQLAERANLDAAYVAKWLDAAFAVELVDVEDDAFGLTELGEAFLPDAPQTMMPLAIQSVLGSRLTDRVADLMRTGEQPGESILKEFENITPWFGRMLEAKFGPYFRQNVLPELDLFEQIDQAGGRLLDLGCGNGWYLRKLAGTYDRLTGLGIDVMEPGIRQAREAARANGLDDRLEFRAADIFDFRPDSPFDAIGLNRTLHHLWGRRSELMETIDAALDDDGYLVVWEPAYPADRRALRDPGKQMLGMRNLAEHGMQNRLLEPREVRETLAEIDLTVDVHQIDEVETLFVGRR